MLTVINSLIDICNVVVLFIVFTFMFTLLGAALFSDRFKFDEEDNYDIVNGESPRANFDGMLSAITSVFIVI